MKLELKEYHYLKLLTATTLLFLSYYQISSASNKNIPKNKDSVSKNISTCLEKANKTKKEKAERAICMESLAKKYSYNNQFKKSLQVLNTAAKKNIKLTLKHSLLARNYYALKNWSAAYSNSKSDFFQNSGSSAENLKILITTSRKKSQWGPCVFYLNKALRKPQIITNNLFYYKNSLICAEKMGNDDNFLFDLYSEAYTKFPTKSEFLRGLVKYSRRMNNVQQTKLYSSKLEKKLYSTKAKIQKIDLNNLIKGKIQSKLNINSISTKQASAKDTLYIKERSKNARGASKYRVKIFLKKDKALFSKKSNKIRDFQTYTKTVYSPEDGIVEYVYKKENDHKPGEAKANKRSNYVIIMHSLNRYSYILNLQKDSIKLIKGQLIKKGDSIGRIGLTGNCNFPVLEFELRDRGHFKGRSYPIK